MLNDDKSVFQKILTFVKIFIYFGFFCGTIIINLKSGPDNILVPSEFEETLDPDF